jgi:hypothetical protein
MLPTITLINLCQVFGIGVVVGSCLTGWLVYKVATRKKKKEG